MIFSQRTLLSSTCFMKIGVWTAFVDVCIVTVILLIGWLAVMRERLLRADDPTGQRNVPVKTLRSQPVRRREMSVRCTKLEEAGWRNAGYCGE